MVSQESDTTEQLSVHAWLIHIVAWQKPTSHCKAIILRLKKKKSICKKTKRTRLGRRSTRAVMQLQQRPQWTPL